MNQFNCTPRANRERQPWAMLQSTRKQSEKILLFDADDKVDIYMCKSLRGRLFLGTKRMKFWRRRHKKKVFSIAKLTDSDRAASISSQDGAVLSARTSESGELIDGSLIEVDRLVRYHFHYLAADTQSTQEEQQKITNYRLLTTCGEGAFSNVYKAICVTDERVYALKVLKAGTMRERATSSMREPFRNEYVTLSKLNHPNIVQAREYYEHDTRAFIALEFCCGGSLQSRLDADELLAERRAKIIFHQVLSALAYLHRHDTVHRDMKPDNVLLMSAASDKIKLADFGFATCGRREMYDCVGTVLYSAPELASKFMDYDARPYTKSVDVWSMGVSLYFTVSGQFPFTDAHSTELYLSNVRLKEASFDADVWSSDRVSYYLPHLLKLIFVAHTERPTCTALLTHPWFSEDSTLELDLKQLDQLKLNY